MRPRAVRGCAACQGRLRAPRAPDHDSAWCSCRGKHPAPLCPDGRSVSAPRQPAAMNAPVTVKSSGVLVMSAPLTTCAVMLAMRPVAPSSPNAAPRTCEREGGRRVEGGRRERDVWRPRVALCAPMRRAAHRRVEALRGEAVEHRPASRRARVREERERDDRGLPPSVESGLRVDVGQGHGRRAK